MSHKRVMVWTLLLMLATGLLDGAAVPRAQAFKVYLSCLVLCPLAAWAGTAIRVSLR